MNGTAWTLKSELIEDWHLLLPVFQLLAIVIVIFAGIFVLRYIMRVVVVMLIMIWRDKHR